MTVHEFQNGDRIEKYKRCLVAKFVGKRKVMGTSAWHNGGYQEDLTAVFNHDVNPGPSKICPYANQTEEDRKKFITEELELDYDTTAYMATIVSMDNAVVKELTYDEITVTTVATASLEVNGGRVGEEATCYEKYGESINLKSGTINIMVFCNCDMTPGCMARVIMTATEAKTAAIQELLIPSLRSSGIATGSGTDNIMIIADSESKNTLTYAGKHGKLGELVGKTVIAAVKEALYKHMGVSPISQHNVIARTSRYGITKEVFEQRVKELPKEYDADAVMKQIMQINSEGTTVGLTSMYIHLLDQYQWGLLNGEEVLKCGTIVLRQLLENLGCSVSEDSLCLYDVNSMNKAFTCCIVKAAVNRVNNKKKEV